MENSVFKIESYTLNIMVGTEKFWRVIDTRSNTVVKDGLTKGSKAAAYKAYLEQELEAAEKEWD